MSHNVFPSLSDACLSYGQWLEEANHDGHSVGRYSSPGPHEEDIMRQLHDSNVRFQGYTDETQRDSAARTFSLK